MALSYVLVPNTLFGVTAIWCSIPFGWFLGDAVGLFFAMEIEWKGIDKIVEDSESYYKNMIVGGKEK